MLWNSQAQHLLEDIRPRLQRCRQVTKAAAAEGAGRLRNILVCMILGMHAVYQVAANCQDCPLAHITQH